MLSRYQLQEVNYNLTNNDKQTIRFYWTFKFNKSQPKNLIEVHDIVLPKW